MEDRGKSSGLLLVLLSIGAFGMVAHHPSNSDGGSGSEKEDRTSTAPASDFREPLLRFFGAGSSQALRSALTAKGAPVLRAIIALVPDPTDAHLTESFDGTMMALTTAAVRHDYLPDAHWIPDLADTRAKAAPACTQTSEVTAARASCGRAASSQHEQPAVLLFRHHKESGPVDELLLVAVVGELPTSGIRKHAFRQALEYLAELRPVLPKGALPVVGPHFSGAAESLRRVMDAWHTEHDWPAEFRVVTGSATDRRNAGIIRGERIQFTATVLPSDVIARTAKDYVRNVLPLGDEGPTAILREETTSYGALPHRDQMIQQDRRKQNGNNQPPPEYMLGAIDLPFPLHISQVGTAYERLRQIRGRETAVDSLRKLLAIDLGDDAESTDVVPALSPMTKYKTELVVENILSVIPRAGVRTVGITATDPRDKVFLARALHKFCPDVNLYTTEADLILSHPDLRGDLRGMLVMSTYPLASQTQLWTPPYNAVPVKFLDRSVWGDPHSRVQFATSSAQGVFNAAQLAIEEATGGARPWVSLIEYGFPGRLQTIPPVWISLIGADGLWPVKAVEIQPAEVADYTYVAGTAPFERPRPAAKLRIPPRHSNPPGRTVLQSTIAGRTAPEPDVAMQTAPLPGQGPILKKLIFPRAMVQWLVLGFFTLALCWMGVAALRGCRGAPSQARLGFIPQSPLISVPPLFVCKDRGALRAYRAFQFFGLMTLAGIQMAATATLLAGYASAYELGVAAVSLVGNAAPSMHLIFGLTLMALGLFAPICVAIRLGRPDHDGADAKRTGPLVFLTWALPVATGAAFLGLALIFVWQVLYVEPAERQVKVAEQLFLYARATSWRSGVSPLIPLLIAALATYAFTLFHLRRIAFACESAASHTPLSVLFRLNTPEGQIERWESAASRVLQGGALATSVPATLAFAGSMALLMWIVSPYGTVEPSAWDWIARVALGVLLVGTAHALLQFVLVWRRARNALKLLTVHPVSQTLQGLKELLRSMCSLHPYAEAPRIDVLLAASHEELHQLEACPDIEVATPFARPAADPPLLRGADRRDTAIELARQLDSCNWGRSSPQAADGGWVGRARRFVALEGVLTIARLVLQLRNLIAFVTVGAVLTLLFVNSYPFQPHSRLTLAVWSLIFAVVATTVTVFVDMERNPVLSYIGGSDPGRITWDSKFLGHVFIYGALPLLTLLATQVPAIGDITLNWMEPILRSAK